jgi:hypothetical protein
MKARPSWKGRSHIRTSGGIAMEKNEVQKFTYTPTGETDG